MTHMTHTTADEVYGSCAGCGQPVRAGQPRWAGREPVELWHHACTPFHKAPSAPAEHHRSTPATPIPAIAVSRTTAPRKPGDRFTVLQPSRKSGARRMQPRHYTLTFTIGADGTPEQVYGAAPRPLYRVVAAVMARNGDLDAFCDGLKDAQDPEAPPPGGNQHPDYCLGFTTGRDQAVMAAERHAPR